LIDFPLNGQPPHLLPDLTDDEIFALGYVTCQWAVLEHAIFVDTIASGLTLEHGRIGCREKRR
jgi:hypothetical protein